eukprot:SAG31_NODE_19349_length_605_cov_0.788538_1_plen_87_part_00
MGADRQASQVPLLLMVSAVAHSPFSMAQDSTQDGSMVLASTTCDLGDLFLHMRTIEEAWCANRVTLHAKQLSAPPHVVATKTVLPQ